MTLTDALAELTLLEKRINSARAKLENNTLITYVEKQKVPIGYKSREEYEKVAKASLQKVNDLIARRREIKRAIVLSNAQTMVTVAHEEMTVAEAIEMKSFIQFSESVLTTMHNSYKQTLSLYERAQNKVKERLDKLALEVLGKNVSSSSDKYQSLADSFLAREGLELLDPTDLAKEIENRQNYIEEFNSTVDRVLSISNARTMIEVPD